MGASSTLSGTQSSDFTLNTDNATVDTQDMNLIFFRGTVPPNAVLSWNSAANKKRFELNQAMYIKDGNASTTNPTFTIQSVANQTANALQIIDNNSAAYFSVNPIGNNTTMINASTTYATLPTFWSSNANITGGTITGITDLTVADGGTGASTLLDHGVLVGSGTDAITALTVGTNGQLLVGSTGADPVFATLNCANGLTCATGAGTLQVDFDGGDSPGGSLGGTWASPTIDDLFILNTGDVGTGSYTFPNASSTYSTISDTAWFNNLVATNATTTTFRSEGLATFGGNVGIGTTTPITTFSVNRN